MGGVLTPQQQRTHYVCAELMQRRLQELARQTVKRWTGGRR